MKKTFGTFIGLFMVLSILLASTGNVIAAPLGNGPVVSAPSGGGDVTTVVIPVAQLPGTEANADGTLFPQGHLNGDMMIGGSGVKVSGLTGSATLSQLVKNYNMGWVGTFYQWVNDSWVRLATSDTPIEDTPNAMAVATIYSDGIYVMILTYRDPSQIVKATCPTDLALVGEYVKKDGGILLTGFIVSGSDPQGWLVVGRAVKFTIVNIDSESHLVGPLSGRANISHTGPYGYAGFYIAQAWSDDVYFYTYTSSPTFTLRVDVNGCFVDAKFPGNFVLTPLAPMATPT